MVLIRGPLPSSHFQLPFLHMLNCRSCFSEPATELLARSLSSGAPRDTQTEALLSPTAWRRLGTGSGALCHTPPELSIRGNPTGWYSYVLIPVAYPELCTSSQNLEWTVSRSWHVGPERRPYILVSQQGPGQTACSKITPICGYCTAAL